MPVSLPGAFYGYFSSKEALFTAIVEPHAHAHESLYGGPDHLAELPEEEQPKHMGVESRDHVAWMVGYICQHREPVKAALLCGGDQL